MVPTAERIAAARAAAEALVGDVLDLTQRITEVPAPTGEEGERSAFVAARFRDAAIGDVQIDEIDDVLESNAEDFVRAYVQKGGQ